MADYTQEELRGAIDRGLVGVKLTLRVVLADNAGLPVYHPHDPDVTQACVLGAIMRGMSTPESTLAEVSAMRFSVCNQMLAMPDFDLSALKFYAERKAR